jgi:hypothetical protein
MDSSLPSKEEIVSLAPSPFFSAGEICSVAMETTTVRRAFFKMF